MIDYYETLQVHPKADAEAIRAAYQRLRKRYSPATLEGAADELVALARRRRDEIEQAFAVLSDPEHRAAHDHELAERRIPKRDVTAASNTLDHAVEEEPIDYRPLPPARRQERTQRPLAQAAQPQAKVARRAGRRASRASNVPTWLLPTMIVGGITFAIVLFTLVNTVDNASFQQAQQLSGGEMQSPSALAATPTTEEIINRFEGQVVAARQVAEQSSENPQAWIELGHALYDSTVVVRERLDNNANTQLQSIYTERVPRWLEAAEAYRKALALQPGDSSLRADLAASLCYFGTDANEQSYVVQGLSEAEQALATTPEEPRVLLSVGLCQALSDPPQTQAALRSWQSLVILPNVDPSLAFQARQLIEEYSR